VRRLFLLIILAGCGGGAAPKKMVPVEVDEPDAASKAKPDAAPAAKPDAGADAEAVLDAPRNSDGPVSFPRRPSCTMEPPAVINGEFEDPAAGTTVPGWQIEATGGATAQWDPISGYAGTGALSLRVPDDATSSAVVARQTLNLQPFTGYSFRGRVAPGNMRPRGDGFYLFQIVVRNGDRTYAIGPRKQDRTDLDYGTYSSDFATGPDGRIDIELRTAGTGHYLVDQVSVSCSDRAQRYMGANLLLTVYDNHVQAATPANIEKVIGNVEQALAAFADLTGQEAAKPSAFPIVAAATEARGNPALWSDTVTAPQWSSAGYLPPSLTVSLARNFDRPAWLFEDDLAQLSVYYAAETKDFTLVDEAVRGKNARRPYELAYQNNWKMGGCPDGAGLIYKNILIRDQIGWEPFKKTFRYFAGLAPAEVPATRWAKLERWYDKLSEFSAMDVRATFTPLDRMLMEARYNPPALPPMRGLATLPLATLMAPLATVQWESATARDRPTRNRLPSECPMLTAAGPAENGLNAYPFSQYVYRLGRRWKRLLTSYSLHAGQTGSVVFIVRGDGRELLKTPAVKDAMPRLADLDVSMVDRLELIVTDAGDGNVSDGALWVNPRLTR
jgi:hypothetical protein